MASLAGELRMCRDEVAKAREALEAKGAFTDANAATHIILALEALLRASQVDRTLNLEERFEAAMTGRAH